MSRSNDNIKSRSIATRHTETCPGESTKTESSTSVSRDSFEGQKKRGTIDPEVLYIGMHMSVQYGPEYQKFYKDAA